MVQSYDTWQNINLLIQKGKYDATKSYWGFQDFTQLCNLFAKDLSYLNLSHNCNRWHLQQTKKAQDCWKLISWIKLWFVLSKENFVLKSTFHRCYCGLSTTSRVIIATFVPAAVSVGASFCMDAVWEWEDTNIRWHTEKYNIGKIQIWEWEDTNIRWHTEK